MALDFQPPFDAQSSANPFRVRENLDLEMRALGLDPVALSAWSELPLGIVLAVLLIVRVDFLVLSWPIGSLLLFTFAAMAVGVIAAILPAQRASRLNILQALQYE